MRYILTFTLLILTNLSAEAWAQIPEAPKEDDAANLALEDKYTRDFDYTYIPKKATDRYNRIVDSLSCPACGKKKLSEVETPLTILLKKEVHNLISTKKSDQEIYDHINQNYNGVISYGIDQEEELEPAEYIPLILCIIALIFALIFIRRKEKIQKESGK